MRFAEFVLFNSQLFKLTAIRKSERLGRLRVWRNSFPFVCAATGTPVSPATAAL